MSVALALDLGTTSTAAVAIDERGRPVEVVRRSHSADIAGLPGDHAEQDPQCHRQCAIDVLRELAARVSTQPVCLGVTGQMHSVLLLDASRQPLRPLVTWQDRRANRPASDGESSLQRMLNRCDPRAIEATGCRLSSGYAAVTLAYLAECGELPVGIERIGLLADWIAAELTETDVVTERSNAASTGVYDLGHDRWSDELIRSLGLQKRWFPHVIPAGTAVGGLSDAAAQATQLPAGLPVMVPIGDNQASVIGSVPQREPAIQITIGTGGQINWPVDEFLRLPGMDTRPLPPDRLMLVGAGMAGGDAFAWVNRTVRSWLAAFGVDADPDDVYETLTLLAGAVPPGADRLLCEPFFRGTRQEPSRRGILTGISNDNLTPGHLARAVLEGIAGSLHACWAGSTDRPENVQRIIGCGNGLERNPLLVEILSQRFGLPVVTPRHGEAAACGAALLAGVGAGLWRTLDEAGDTIELTEPTGASR